MSAAEISDLSLIEKLQVMEAIWEDLRPHAKGAEIHREHLELLDIRQERVATGQAKLVDWQAVIKIIISTGLKSWCGP